MEIGQHVFRKTKLTGDEGSVLEKAFSEMIFESKDVLPVFGFLKTNTVMITIMKSHVTLGDHDNDADLRPNFGYKMIAQIEQNFYNKNFSLQDQCKCDENDNFQKRVKFWLNVFDMEGPVPDNVYDYD